MSFLGYEWKIKAEKLELPLVEQLLKGRGIESSSQKSKFLEPDMDVDLHDPFLLKDMQLSVDRIEHAIKNKQRIMIFGDYDVDGITAAAILYDTLSELGASISYRLPHRVKDGYGLNKKFVKLFKDLGVSLVITVDCGIACADEVTYGKENGIDFIITDHHSIPEDKPDNAHSIIHPGQKDCPYPFKNLTGAGVAFKLAQALYIHFKSPGIEEKTDKLLEMATLGTVADCVPLLGENRVIVKFGLDKLQYSRWPGLSLLKDTSGIEKNAKMDTNAVSYRLAPRLNAAGRLDTSYYSLQLLLSDNSSDQKAQMLEDLNKKRQKVTQNALDELAITHQNLDKKDIILAYSENWPIGIVGLIAGRITEKLFRPCLIMEKRDDTLYGSARSPEFFNLVEALKSQHDLLENYGGHKQAAGFTLKLANFEEFKQGLEKYVEDNYDLSAVKRNLVIDCKLDEKYLNLETYQDINSLAPFGIKNEYPIFVLEDGIVTSISQVGNERRHLKMTIKKGDTSIDCIGFNIGDAANSINILDSIDLAFEMDLNNWNGSKKLQLRVKDIRVK